MNGSQSCQNLKICCLRPRIPLRIETEERDGRCCDRIVTAEINKGENFEFFAEFGAEGLGHSFPVVSVVWDKDRRAKVTAKLLAPFSAEKDAFDVLKVPEQNAVWLRVCVALAEDKYSAWKKDGRSFSRAFHWFREADFEPKDISDIRWYAAVRWDWWRKSKLDWKNCIEDLEKILGKNISGSSSAQFEAARDQLKKFCKSAGLKRDW